MFQDVLRSASLKLAAAATLAASLTVAQASAPASAATVNPLYANGGTAAAFVYRQWGDGWGFPLGGSSCSTTTQITCTEEELYAAVGTGSGQSSFLAHASQGTVGSGEPPYTDTRFPTYPYPTFDFGAGDAPLSTPSLTTYNTVVNGSGTDLARWGPAIVAPLIAVPVALGYNPSGLTVGGSGQPALKLSRNSFCGIMTNNITNWDDPSITADNGGNVVSGGGSLAINVVVRSDGSGTTFILSDALVAQCATSAYPFGFGGVGLGGGTAAPAWPVGDDAQHGSGGVQAEILAKAGSIGYISFNYVQPFAPTGPPAATLENNAANFEVANVADAKAALSGPFDSIGPCGTFMSVQTCYPNPVKNQILYNSNPTASGAYPIVGLTYGYFYTCSTVSNVTKALTGSTALFGTETGKAGMSGALKSQVGGALTAADKIVENNGLVELSNTIKANSVKLLKGIKTGPVSGTCTL